MSGSLRTLRPPWPPWPVRLRPLPASVRPLHGSAPAADVQRPRKHAGKFAPGVASKPSKPKPRPFWAPDSTAVDVDTSILASVGFSTKAKLELVVRQAQYATSADYVNRLASDLQADRGVVRARCAEAARLLIDLATAHAARSARDLADLSHVPGPLQPVLEAVFPLQVRTPSVNRDVAAALRSHLIEAVQRAQTGAPADELYRRGSAQSALRNEFPTSVSPAEWYPGARAMTRRWILHLGPTNSGKTYNALKRLGEARSGIYAGPLRLLAREIYERYQANGIRCNLVTGEEIIEDVDEHGARAPISASTVEMVDLKTPIDVAVIDEIQMIADPDRGWAWTAAVLGLQAKEVHVCGEERALELLQRLARSVGDEVEIRKYERLSPLVIDDVSLNGRYSELRPGDCVVAFSRKQIFQIRQRIESATKLKCAVIYGGLPPEVRSRQAQLFNDQDSGYDILVASDAIGMGLNLSIKRIVLSTTSKFDGKDTLPLSPSQVNQIAGRAGRYMSGRNKDGTASTPRGHVTTLLPEDLPYLQMCMAMKPTMIQRAGILAPNWLIEYAASFHSDGVPLDVTMGRALRSLTDSDLYFSCDLRVQSRIASVLQAVPELTVAERLTFSSAPAKLKLPMTAEVLQDFARAVVSGMPHTILHFPQIPFRHLEARYNSVEQISNDLTGRQLDRLESLHSTINLYIWLSYRFPTILLDRESAIELNYFCRALIDSGLNQSTALGRRPARDQPVKGRRRTAY
ncbi:P-loop containing nucleoside triphosphate hydrolase protein [Dipodascopsis tothii]|uniref:P-loop containing nucleoside triphosphate hydrolase protein n=1 Tax=Dipodascopsis tothii TaxID=44089 RepID=UPI0034CE653D